jgi:GNAT superfamily N-acetyltransferase
MNTRISLRPATEKDAPSIAKLTRELGYPATALEIRRRIKDILASDHDLLVVAEESSRVAGWFQAHASVAVESGFRVEIVGLVVSSAARRRGVGRALVAEAERWAARQGAETVVVRSNQQRVESHAFYPALGYKVAKTQMVYRKRVGS